MDSVLTYYSIHITDEPIHECINSFTNVKSFHPFIHSFIIHSTFSIQYLFKHRTTSDGNISNAGIPIRLKTVLIFLPWVALLTPIHPPFHSWIPCTPSFLHPSIESQVLARDARPATTTTTKPGSTPAEPRPPFQPPPTTPSTEGHDGFTAVESKTIHPLDFFKISGVDVASGTVPISSQRCPDMAVVLEMRLEADARRGGAGTEFGRGMRSTRCCEVRKKVSVEDIVCPRVDECNWYSV